MSPDSHLIRWRCGDCHFAGSDGAGVPVYADEFPVHCVCGATETYEQALSRNPDFATDRQPRKRTRCRHLGGMQHAFNGRWLACGCSRVYLYPCAVFDELVTLHEIRPPNKIDTAEDVRQAIRDYHPEYKGRACQGCAAYIATRPPSPTSAGGVAMIPHHLVAVEYTEPLQKTLETRREKLGACLVPSARYFGALRTNQFSWAVALTDDSPHAVAQVLDTSGMMALLVDSEHRARQIRPHTRRPVITSLDQLASINGVQLVSRLNLIYHVCPLKANDGWRDNLYELLQRWGIFTGRKLIAVANGPGLHDLATVQALVRRSDVEWLPIRNDPQLREVASFGPLLSAISNTCSSEATFYGHSKGNSTADNAQGAWLWTLAMYRHLLDQPEVIRDALRQYAAVGCCKMVWPKGSKAPYPSALPVGHWMFAGTFFWFRHDRVFTQKPRWRNVPQDRYGAEAWLSTLLDESEVLSVYQPWPISQYPTPSPYNPLVHRGRF